MSQRFLYPVIDYYVDNFSADLIVALMQLLAHPSQGGEGYKIVTFNPAIDLDGWEIDTNSKTIKLDTRSIFGHYSHQELAEHLRNAIQTEILETRSSLFSRLAWGSGKVLLGIVETGIGLVGIIVPDPGTTAAGVGLVFLGVNSFVDGVSQLAGANEANGYNMLGSAFGAAGEGIAEIVGFESVAGKQLGENLFAVTSLAFGSIGSIKILNIKSLSSIRFGVGGQPGGFEVGRLAMGYSSNRALDGMTILSINNNAGQSILRFVTHNGKFVVNGRIVGTQKILKHESNPGEIAKGILRLLLHGFKSGL